MKRLFPMLLLLLVVTPAVGQEYVFTPYGPERGVPRDIVTDVVQDHRGFVWVALARHGVRRLDGRHAVMLRSERFPLSHEAFALETDGANLLFIGGNDGVVVVRLNDTAQDSVDLALTAMLQAVPPPVRRLEMTRSHHLHIETPTGSWEWNPRDSTLSKADERPPVFGQLAGRLPEYSIRDMAKDCLRRSWLATDRGLLLHDETEDWLFDSSNGLPVNDLRCVMVDREANVWCGSSRGLYLHVPARSMNLGFGSSLPAGFGEIRCMLEAGDHSLWIGGDGGLLRLFAGSPERYDSGDGLPSSSVRCLLELPSGDILVGTDSGLIVRQADGGFVPPPPMLALPGPRVTAMLQAADGSYWIATSGGLLLWDGRRRQVVSVADGLPTNEIHAIAEDAYGLIWLGSSEGLIRLSNPPECKVHIIDELRDLSIPALYVDDKDRLWVGTEGAGVYVRSEGRQHQLTMEDGLAGNGIGFIIADNHGSMYFGTGNGVSVLPRANIRSLLPADSAGLLHVRNIFADLPFLRATAMFTLGPSTGLLGRDHAHGAVLRDSGGRMWLAGSDGISSYRPPRPLAFGYWQPPLCRAVIEGGKAVPDYRIHVAEICINDTCTAQRGRITLGPDDHVLRVRVLLPAFRNGDDLQYLYQLRGMEYTWHRSRDGDILYTGLEPGSYELVVQASLGEGAWTRRIHLLNVDVTAPWYDSVWLWVFLVILAAALGFLAQQQRHAWLLASERRRRDRDRGDMFYNPN